MQSWLVMMGGGTLDTSPATWTVEADGVNNSTTSTEITISFNKQVALVNENVVITGVASKSGAPLISSGNNWIIPITVGAAPGTATVTINQTGIQAGSKSITVHKAGIATPITWTAVQTGGTSNTATSTGIKITFSENVSLSLSDVTVGGDASKGTALSGSGKDWTIPITVINQGSASVSISKTGVDANPQNIEVFKLAPSLNGKTWFRDSYTKVVFTATGYTIYQAEREKEYGDDYPDDEDDWWWGQPILENGKYKWTYIHGTGSYTRNGFTASLTPITYSHDGELMDKSQWETLYRNDIAEYIEYLMEVEGLELADILNEYGAPSNLSLQQAIDLYVSEQINADFATVSYDYFFLDSAEQVLFLQERLPQSNGTWLSGEYKGVSWSNSNESYVKNDNMIYTFTSGGLYTYTYYGIERETGSYVCVTGWGQNRVILRNSTYEGMTSTEYFAYLKDNGGNDNRYDNENDYYASYSSYIFRTNSEKYDTAAKVIGWWDGDAFPVSPSINFFPRLSSRNNGVKLSMNVKQ